MSLQRFSFEQISSHEEQEALIGSSNTHRTIVNNYDLPKVWGAQRSVGQVLCKMRKPSTNNSFTARHPKPDPWTICASSAPSMVHLHSHRYLRVSTKNRDR